MTELSYWLLFLSAALALSISPGPDLLYILSRTVAQGVKVGAASAIGVCTGALIHVMAAALGLSALLATSALAFSAVKYVGAAYLIYLGIQALRSSGGRLQLERSTVLSATPMQAFRQGVLVDALNPKVAIFFMAFLPQFVRPEHGNAALQLIGLGVLVILVGMVVELSFVFLAARATRFFREHRRASVWLDRLFGSILVGLGVRLALASPKL